MTADVVILEVETKLDIPPKRVLTSALKADLERVIVVGANNDGELYFAAGPASPEDVLWLLELAKKELMGMIP